jgi:hypothetical protein
MSPHSDTHAPPRSPRRMLDGFTFAGGELQRAEALDGHHDAVL